MVLRGVRTSTLVKVALGGGVVCLGAAISWMERVQYQVRQTDPFQDAMRLFLGYTAGKELLGEPVSIKRLDLSPSGPVKITPTRSQIAIPVKGKLSTGNIYAYSSRPNETNRWTVDRMDLEVDATEQRWTFYKGPGFDNTPYVFDTKT